MDTKLLISIIWSFYALKGAAQPRLSLHLSKCHIVGNHDVAQIMMYSIPEDCFSITGANVKEIKIKACQNKPLHEVFRILEYTTDLKS